MTTFTTYDAYNCPNYSNSGLNLSIEHRQEIRLVVNVSMLKSEFDTLPQEKQKNMACNIAGLILDNEFYIGLRDQNAIPVNRRAKILALSQQDRQREGFIWKRFTVFVDAFVPPDQSIGPAFRYFRNATDSEAVVLVRATCCDEGTLSKGEAMAGDTEDDKTAFHLAWGTLSMTEHCEIRELGV